MTAINPGEMKETLKERVPAEGDMWEIYAIHIAPPLPGRSPIRSAEAYNITQNCWLTLHPTFIDPEGNIDDYYLEGALAPDIIEEKLRLLANKERLYGLAGYRTAYIASEDKNVRNSHEIQVNETRYVISESKMDLSGEDAWFAGLASPKGSFLLWPSALDSHGKISEFAMWERSKDGSFFFHKCDSGEKAAELTDLPLPIIEALLRFADDEKILGALKAEYTEAFDKELAHLMDAGRLSYLGEVLDQIFDDLSDGKIDKNEFRQRIDAEKKSFCDFHGKSVTEFSERVKAARAAARNRGV